MAHLASRPARRFAARRPLPALALVLALAVTALAAACGGDSAPVLSGEAGRGQQVARDKGCTSCHTATGNKSEGPTWKGLAGSSVTLADGTTVVADDAYLTRSIQEPRAQLVQGFKTAMPVTPLPDADIAAVVAYINALK
jgi:cytochrome c oxidase subunit 2